MNALAVRKRSLTHVIKGKSLIDISDSQLDQDQLASNDINMIIKLSRLFND